MHRTQDLTTEQKLEERQEYGSRLVKRSKALLDEGLLRGHLTPRQASVLTQRSLALIELGIALVQEGLE